MECPLVHACWPWCVVCVARDCTSTWCRRAQHWTPSPGSVSGFFVPLTRQWSAEMYVQKKVEAPKPHSPVWTDCSDGDTLTCMLHGTRRAFVEPEQNNVPSFVFVRSCEPMLKLPGSLQCLCGSGTELPSAIDGIRSSCMRDPVHCHVLQGVWSSHT